nr:uncharacterized protein LOC129282903 [Lytechinus pictus]
MTIILFLTYQCWICEFCETENPVTDDTVVPTTEDSTYVEDRVPGECLCKAGSAMSRWHCRVSRRSSMAEQRSRAPQQEALNAQMLASYQETIEGQAQALAPFQIAKGRINRSSDLLISTTSAPLGQAAPSARPGATLHLASPVRRPLWLVACKLNREWTDCLRPRLLIAISMAALEAGVKGHLYVSITHVGRGLSGRERKCGRQGEEGQCWICEFCETENPVTDDTVVPTTEDSTYVIGPGSGGGADTLVIFCVDVSGSMAVTTEVSGEVSVQGRRSDEQVALQAYQEELDAAEQRSRAAQQEALNAQMLASYQETIEDQAQALAQFQIARTASTASSASVRFPPPPPPMGQAAPSAPPGTLPPPSPQPSAAPSVAGSVQGERHSELEERYVAAPQRSFVGSKRQAPPRPPPPSSAATAAPRPTPPPPVAAPEPKKHVSYVSRLQSMQSAIQQQVDKLQAENSHKRVGLVAFNNNVTVIGDGSLDPVPLEGAGLTDRESLISLGQNFPLPGPISEVHRCLTDKIYSLTESGQTALGPALLIAISMAAQKPGSKVIMCTDGMANVGLGALNDMDNDAAYEEAAAFYDEVGNFARDSGVCVSVLTLEGEDCRAIELGSVADKTRGQVSIVKANDLNQQFADILADPVLATNVSARMVLHKGLFFRDSENDSSQSQATHNVGLVTADSETTFEFGVRRKEVIYDNYGGTTVVERVEDEPIYESVAQTMIEGLERLPFQVQIRYTGRDGLDYQRILTMDRPVTKDRKFAEQNANVGVIGAHAAQSAAKLAVEGAYAQAQINAVITQKLVQRCTQPEEGQEQEGIYQTFLANMAPINSEITRAHQQEWDAGEYMELEIRSGGESGDDDVPLVTKNKKMSKKMKNRHRRTCRTGKPVSSTE